ncbi:MAG: membrane dipeptidase [Myxococcota bacterium]
MEPSPRDLNPAGRELLKRAEQRRMLVDLSHASDLTAREVLEATRWPVVISHDAARALVDHPRCTPDDILRTIGDHGGVVGVFMMTVWLTRAPTPTVDHVIQQICHIANVAGSEAVGLANDYLIEGHTGLHELDNDNRKGANVRALVERAARPEDRGLPVATRARRSARAQGHRALVRAERGARLRGVVRHRGQNDHGRQLSSGAP